MILPFQSSELQSLIIWRWKYETEDIRILCNHKIVQEKSYSCFVLYFCFCVRGWQLKTTGSSVEEHPKDHKVLLYGRKNVSLNREENMSSYTWRKHVSLNWGKAGHYTLYISSQTGVSIIAPCICLSECPCTRQGPSCPCPWQEPPCLWQGPSCLCQEAT